MHMIFPVLCFTLIRAGMLTHVHADLLLGAASLPAFMYCIVFPFIALLTIIVIQGGKQAFGILPDMRLVGNLVLIGKRLFSETGGLQKYPSLRAYWATDGSALHTPPTPPLSLFT